MRLIDADALIKELEAMANNDWNVQVGSSKGLEDAIDVIDNAPTVQRPQGEWIPVSERLPEPNKEVIVTDIETKDTYCSWYHGNGYWECDNGVFKNRIIAWQPLPEPYKKGGTV